MNQTTTGHPLAGLHRALREADLVLVPVDPAVESPFAAGATDVLQALCASPLARAWIARAGARWAVSEDAPCEPSLRAAARLAASCSSSARTASAPTPRPARTSADQLRTIASVT